jgi:hypothetical protein
MGLKAGNERKREERKKTYVVKHSKLDTTTK